MKRTNISLKKWQYEYLKERAQREDVSMSGLVREMVEEYASRETEAAGNDPIHDIVGAANGENENVAREHDRHLYDTEVSPKDPERDD